MRGIKARHNAAEALYNAICQEVGRLDQYTDQATALETLAHAYAMVGEAGDPEPVKEAVKAAVLG
jgi:hypothetical protein